MEIPELQNPKKMNKSKFRERYLEKVLLSSPACHEHKKEDHYNKQRNERRFDPAFLNEIAVPANVLIPEEFIKDGSSNDIEDQSVAWLQVESLEQ